MTIDIKAGQNKKIKALFFINTPAQAHTWRYVIENLTRKGHEVAIVARDYGPTLGLLNSFGLQFHSFKPIANKSLRLFELVVHLQNGWKACRGFSPNILVGFGVDAAIMGALLRKPSINFIDNDHTHFQNKITGWFTSAIITPACFQEDLGNKQIRINGYKEMAYLHSNYFKPDPSIFSELGLAENEKYVILRFNVFDAVHDIGKYGFSEADQFRLVKELEKHARIFISPEGKLSEELEKYRLTIDISRIHHALYYAHLLVTDAGTMTTEAAVLGTPAVFAHSIIGLEKMGNFIELEKKYALIYAFPRGEEAVQKAMELVQQPDLKEQWAKKRQLLISEKIDATQFMVDFIENHFQSHPV